ncbi:hypothetical protein EPN90_00865 [Patescibacteria group bacterium]|nr:MAG: hypothetical protein EPN90_00865 [Patescibacteria group bacterium]
MTIIDGLFTGLVIGFITSIPAVISEIVRHGKNLPLLIDVKEIGTHHLKEKYVLEWSLFLHLGLSAVFGGFYPALVSLGAFATYSFFSVALYGLIFYLFFGLFIFPAIGLGLFGRREGHLVWLELLLTSVLYVAGFWYAATFLFIS